MGDALSAPANLPGRLAAPSGLSQAATVRRAARVCDRIIVALPEAVDEVAAMPAGAIMLDVFADVLLERTRLVAANEPRSPPRPTIAPKSVARPGSVRAEPRTGDIAEPEPLRGAGASESAIKRAEKDGDE